jgi:WD40 repeat protein
VAAVGTALLVGIPAILATLHAGDSQFRWWWPTDWMAVPSVIFLSGCFLAAIPVRRSADQHAVGAGRPVPPRRDLVRLPSPPPLPSYRERISEIARRTPVLYGRDELLAELAGFATGSEGYRWLTGRPWAGKTALAVRLVTSCPPTVDCVAYFLTRRLSDADSGRFVTVVANQLAWLLCDDSAPLPDDPDALIGLWRRAVEAAVRDDRHLLLVVDGLDEDVSRSLGRPSVASLIPAFVGEHAHVLVTSRRGFELPADVDVGSALRRVPRGDLADIPHATQIAQAAENELTLLLDRPDELAFDCIGLLAAAEGALSVDDLLELATYAGHSSRYYRIQRIIDSEIARVLEPVGPGPIYRYTFAHDQLRSGSEKKLSYELPAYRQHLQRWADHYRTADWPADTPRYLLDSYPSMITRHQPTQLRRLLEDFGYLEVSISNLGGDEVGTTARTASIAEPSLAGLARCIEQQAHHLRPANPARELGYATWQLCLQSLRLGDTKLADRAGDWLTHVASLRMIPQWSSGRSSRSLVRSVPGPAGAVAISANGQRALTGGGLNGRPGELLLWDLSGGHPTSRALPGHTTYVAAVALSPDGLHAITGSKADTGGGELLLWDLSGEQPASLSLPHPPWIRAAGISADGRWGITGGSVLVFWPLMLAEFRSYTRLRTKQWVHSAAISANGMRGLSGGGEVYSKNGELLLWDDLAGEEPTSRVLAGHTGGVLAVAVSAEGTRAISSGSDESGEAGELLLWDLSGKRPTSQPLMKRTGGIQAVAMSADGQRAASGRRRELTLWDLSTERPASRALVGHTREVESVAISADNRWAISGSAAELLIWDLSVQQPAAERPYGPAGWVRAVAISGDGMRALTGGGDVYSKAGELLLWDLSRGQPTSRSLPCPSGWVGGAAMSADGRRALTGGAPEGGGVLLWDLSGDEPASRPLPGRTGGISADGQRAISSSDRELWLWDLSGQEPESRLQRDLTGAINGVALSADGRWAVTYGGPPFVRRDVLLWDLSGKEATSRPLVGPTMPVEAVAISSDGRRVVSGGGDPSGPGEVLLWDLSAQELIGQPLPGPASRVRAVAMSADGHWVISCSSAEIHVRDLVSGTTIRTFTEGQVTSVSVTQLTEHHLQLLVGEWAGTVTAWTVYG